ncbi:hypothetical protein PKNA1_C2_0509750 [Plasmodium knowlesi strain H]|uniref:Uncharacterized protein n=1 Tax=Plasmodium knowlesi (strain H) TaxID=5851 RepID=A0A1A7W2H3_PLAKH|nr:hypothetical protein PKNA1_C2_0509750 [Plasmodium knowlesi strain H]SBO28190.1 hypothetical protein PKNA1_H1_0509750 [Plasmodium knowlesi strain H]
MRGKPLRNSGVLEKRTKGGDTKHKPHRISSYKQTLTRKGKNNKRENDSSSDSHIVIEITIARERLYQFAFAAIL